MRISPCQPCPSCRAKGCLEIFAHYERYLVEWDGEKTVTHTLRVARYRCSCCRRTHAALPSCLVPYKSYSLRFLLTVVREYFIRRCCVEQICQKYGISVATLYRWVRLFLKQKSLWLGVLEDAVRLPTDFLDDMSGEILIAFHRTFFHSFFGRFYGKDRELPFSGAPPFAAFTGNGNGNILVPLVSCKKTAGGELWKPKTQQTNNWRSPGSALD